MLHKYEFALVRYMGSAERGEHLNIGIVVWRQGDRTLLWDDDFKPPHWFEKFPLPSSAMLQWKEYFRAECVASDKVSETRETLEKYAIPRFTLGATRIYLTHDVEFDEVARALFKELVAR